LVVFGRVKAPARGTNAAIVVYDEQIESTTVDELERQFNLTPMAVDDVHAVDGGHAALDLEIGRH
jgi:hypothetical protein